MGEAMLELALRAGLPLIQVRTTDVVNFEAILGYVSRRTPIRITGKDRISAKMKPEGLFWSAVDPDVNPASLYRILVEKHSTLVLVNTTSDPIMFDAGVVPVPVGFVRSRLEEAGVEGETLDEILPGLSGLTFKEAAEAVRVAQASEGFLSLQSVVRARQQCFSEVRGLHLVDTHQFFYQKVCELEEYLEETGRFLLEEKPVLRPRGLLLYGPPGGGKTTAAKRVAIRLKIPLMRLDMGSIRGKYVGESEGALRDALAQVERESPCVLLIDEVEKELADQDDNGVSYHLFAQILWWMAEHRFRILTIMTTNDRGKIPIELVRPGRVDEQVRISGFCPKEAKRFYDDMLLAVTLQGTSLRKVPPVFQKSSGQRWKEIEQDMRADETTMTAAALEREVIKEVRSWLKPSD
jgi:hypothetical protein